MENKPCGNCHKDHEGRTLCRSEDLKNKTPMNHKTTGWEDDYENERDNFLVFDKASGSRWLNDENLKQFISRLLENEKEKERERVLAALSALLKDWNIGGLTTGVGTMTTEELIPILRNRLNSPLTKLNV